MNITEGNIVGNAEIDNNEELKELDFTNHTRVLSKVEYANLAEKSKKGAIPVEYFRKNLFYPTTTKDKSESRDSSFKKVIYNGTDIKISVNQYLHQRHKDVLTILFSDNLGVSQPLADGTYFIYTNLTHIAKEMGYNNPNSSIARVKDFLKDLRNTDIIISEKLANGKTLEHGHKLLGDYSLDTTNNFYKVEIPAKTAKYHILEYAVEIPKEINKRILHIPYTLPRLKAVINYLLSHKILKNGIGLVTVMDALNISTPKTKATFRKEIETNIDTLKDFNIEYELDTKKFFLTKSMDFIRNVTHEEAIKSYKDEKLIPVLDKKPKKQTTDYDVGIEGIKDIGYLRLQFANKYIRILDKDYLIQNFIYSEDKTQILIEADFGGFIKKIPTRLKGIDEIIAKVTAYNIAYFDSRYELEEVGF